MKRRIFTRKVRNAVVGVGCLSFSGCSSKRRDAGSRNNTGDGSATATSTRASNTSTENSQNEFEFSTNAKITSQSTSDHPPRVELSIVNKNEETIYLGPADDGGLPLEYDPRGELIFYPVDPKHVSLQESDINDFSENGDCWRAPEDIQIAVENYTFTVELKPDEKYSIEHNILSKNDSDTCYTSNKYTKYFLCELFDDSRQSIGHKLECTYNILVGENDGLVISDASISKY
jgi:hypothetical protein